MRLREWAASCVCFGSRGVSVSLRRDGWRVNAKRIYRLYTEDGLTVRTNPHEGCIAGIAYRRPWPRPRTSERTHSTTTIKTGPKQHRS